MRTLGTHWGEVGLLGLSAVGKSTLINALLSERLSILPQGGVGPLTASPIRITYNPEPFFGALYWPENQLRELTSRVEGQLVSDRGRTRRATADMLSLRKARLLIRGSQFGKIDVQYLVAGLHAALGDTDAAFASKGDQTRIAAVRDCLSTPRAGRSVMAGEDLPQFLSQIRQHAAGHLSPITREVRVGWDCDLLKLGVSLIDLPGLGVAHDAYRFYTSEWLKSGRIVLLVVGRSGIPEAATDILRSSGFVERLATETNMSLAIALTHIDSSAHDAQRQERLATEGCQRNWAAHFEEVCAAGKTMIRNQLSAEFPRYREQLLERVSIHPVSAPEYQRFYRKDPEDPAHLPCGEESGVPELGRRLARYNHP